MHPGRSQAKADKQASRSVAPGARPLFDDAFRMRKTAGLKRPRYRRPEPNGFNTLIGGIGRCLSRHTRGLRATYVQKSSPFPVPRRRSRPGLIWAVRSKCPNRPKGLSVTRCRAQRARAGCCHRPASDWRRARCQSHGLMVRSFRGDGKDALWDRYVTSRHSAAGKCDGRWKRRSTGNALSSRCSSTSSNTFECSPHDAGRPQETTLPPPSVHAHGWGCGFTSPQPGPARPGSVPRSGCPCGSYPDRISRSANGCCRHRG